MINVSRSSILKALFLAYTNNISINLNLPCFCTFSHQKMAFFTSFCTSYFDIQEITLTFTFQNGGTSREWC